MKVWVWSLVLHKLGMMAYSCNPSSWELETGRSEVDDHPWLVNLSIGYMKHCSRKEKRKRKMVTLFERNRVAAIAVPHGLSAFWKLYRLSTAQMRAGSRVPSRRVLSLQVLAYFVFSIYVKFSLKNKNETIWKVFSFELKCLISGFCQASVLRSHTIQF